ncbi:helix-turn-helix domain-containing protein [uncultured Tateyamaria sp.]|uniref:helix-turn-helix domain-containing protein n=1 Tax=uncultured Tateyamaria sp. TaxID=455651 RepID=UPI00261D1B49|nr:helix-turn-helix domain-containing protein [uncultured Tateyamaria sp.]
MTRSYKGIRAKKHWVYSVEDLMLSYGVTRNTISNWVNEGLMPSNSRRPYVFRGAAVQDFLQRRLERRQVKLSLCEFYCFTCKVPVTPIKFDREPLATKSGAQVLQATCPRCKRTVTKFGNLEELDVHRLMGATNTNGDQTDEGVIQASGDIWIWHNRNDRIVHKWQISAGRFADATVDAHLRAIRFLEDVLQGKSFTSLSTVDIDRVRSELKLQLSGARDAPKSRSSVSHTSSHIRKFLVWLLKQDFASDLPKDLPDYIELPKAVYAQCLPRPQKEYPLIEEAEAMLERMPSQTLPRKRDRAMFAIAFLGALRADTLVSLRLKHLSVAEKMIIQDGTVSRTKNGKSLEIWWFPISEAFSAEVTKWEALIRDLGFHDDDPLFPDLKYLLNGYPKRYPNAPPIEPMKTKTAVNKTFAIASSGAKAHYTPHSAKHTMAAERDRRHLTARERKAWLENIGHDTEQITDRHYGQLSGDERRRALKNIGDGSEQLSVLERLTNDELGAGLREFLMRHVVEINNE